MIFITKVNDNHIVCPQDGFSTRTCSTMAIHSILQRHTSSSINKSWRACSGRLSICRGASVWACVGVARLYGYAWSVSMKVIGTPF